MESPGTFSKHNILKQKRYKHHIEKYILILEKFKYNIKVLISRNLIKILIKIFKGNLDKNLM